MSFAGAGDMVGAGRWACRRVGAGSGMAMSGAMAGIAVGMQSVDTHCVTGQSAPLQQVRAGAAASRELCSTKTSAMTRARNCRMA